MNIPEIEKQVLPYLIKLAESPPVQAEIEAAKAAIISIIESQSLSISKRVIRWIRNKIKRGNVKMSTTTITVKNSEGTVLSGATISYVVSAVTVDGTTDTAGQLTISDLEAGTYTFTAVLDGYTSASVDVTVTADADVTGTITLEGESTLSTVTDAAKTAAETAATAVATELANQALAELTKTDDDGQTLIEKGTALITKLTKEIGTTNDWFVKFIRNPAEIVVLTGLIAGAGAGVASAISELKDKLK
ncbi:carboxypeptidase-like regulatory domain-containing protein [Sporomusa silvacetica]|nr:carboxypeptidase-like regulatory domain-containing protein [Sporomusa silvacetica]